MAHWLEHRNCQHELDKAKLLCRILMAVAAVGWVWLGIVLWMGDFGA